MSEWSDLEGSSPNYIMRQQGERLDRIIELLEKLCELISSQSSNKPVFVPTPWEGKVEAWRARDSTSSADHSPIQHGQKPPQDAPSTSAFPKQAKTKESSHKKSSSSDTSL